MTLAEITTHCQKELNNPNWYPLKMEAINGGTLVTGAIYALKKDGKINYRKKEKGTFAIFIGYDK